MSNDTQIAFWNACEDGNLDLAKQLFDAVNNDEDVFDYDFEQCFQLVCEYGELHVAKWLLEIKPIIDVSADDESSFIAACKNGHLEVAKWLLAIKPDIDISADNESAFCYACENGHIKVAKWLQCLCPWKYKIIVNKHSNKIKKYTAYINSEEEIRKEQNFQRRKTALFLSKFTNDSLMFRLPGDISRHIITNFM